MNISRPTRSLSVSAVLHRKRLGRGAAALRLAALLVTTAVWMGCNESALVPCSEPQVVTSIVAVNPNNVLSATVATTVRSADSVAVRFGPAAQQMGMITPAVDGSSESMVLPVFGLMPGTDYEMQVVAFNGCSTAPGPTLRLSTETLPADLPKYSASGSDPSPGYVAFAAGNYGLVIDNSGRVVWYHRFPNGPGLNFQPQRNGHYAARPSPGTTG
ncbi:MAG: hypothetical protein ABIS03_07945, partial [Gemmatimonadaceae bacterium]